MKVSAAASAIVIGDGIVGLCVAWHAAQRRVRVTLVSARRSGAASPASAGMLAPSVERTQGPAQAFGEQARDAWDRLAAGLGTGGASALGLRRHGLLRVALEETDVARLQQTLGPFDEWLTARDARSREPALGPVLGGALYTGDGLVHAPHAVDVLERAVRANPRVQVRETAAAEVRTSPGGAAVLFADGSRLESDAVVLAAGAWTPQLGGLPRPLPIYPLRGSLVAVDGIALNEPVYGPGAHTYLFPRDGSLVIGATSDDVGFDTDPVEGEVAGLIADAAALVPAATGRNAIRTWVGLRPATADGNAFIGREPAAPTLIYACGHTRNGFLQAPLTGEVVGAVLRGTDPGVDLTPFRPERFTVE